VVPVGDRPVEGTPHLPGGGELLARPCELREIPGVAFHRVEVSGVRGRQDPSDVGRFRPGPDLRGPGVARPVPDEIDDLFRWIPTSHLLKEWEPVPRRLGSIDPALEPLVEHVQ
jgi:hypothetical protein